MTRETTIIIGPSYQGSKEYIKLLEEYYRTTNPKEKEVLKEKLNNFEKKLKRNIFLIEFNEFNGDMYPKGYLDPYTIIINKIISKVKINGSFEKYIKSYVKAVELINFVNTYFANNFYSGKYKYTKNKLFSETAILRNKKNEIPTINLKELVEMNFSDYTVIANLLQKKDISLEFKEKNNIKTLSPKKIIRTFFGTKVEEEIVLSSGKKRTLDLTENTLIDLVRMGVITKKEYLNNIDPYFRKILNLENDMKTFNENIKQKYYEKVNKINFNLS